MKELIEDSEREVTLMDVRAFLYLEMGMRELFKVRTNALHICLTMLTSALAGGKLLCFTSYDLQKHLRPLGWIHVYRRRCSRLEGVPCAQSAASRIH